MIVLLWGYLAVGIGLVLVGLLRLMLAGWSLHGRMYHPVETDIPTRVARETHAWFGAVAGVLVVVVLWPVVVVGKGHLSRWWLRLCEAVGIKIDVYDKRPEQDRE
jgi:hypothetical protein